jgi:hypothetical protein
MKREEYIQAVLVKLEEVSPYNDIADGLIAVVGDSTARKVKPIATYIDECLDEACCDMLQVLPLHMLSTDVIEDTSEATCTNRGVMLIPIGCDFLRFVRFHQDELYRDIYHLISQESQSYLLQQNEFTRGGRIKPVAARVGCDSDSMIEVYSFPDDKSRRYTLHYIPRKKAEQIHSPISEFIVLKAAIMVLGIFGQRDEVAILTEELSRLVDNVRLS